MGRPRRGRRARGRAGIVETPPDGDRARDPDGWGRGSSTSTSSRKRARSRSSTPACPATGAISRRNSRPSAAPSRTSVRSCSPTLTPITSASPSASGASGTSRSVSTKPTPRSPEARSSRRTRAVADPARAGHLLPRLRDPARAISASSTSPRCPRSVTGATLDVPGTPRVIHVPGHTAGSVALHLPGHDAILVGDAFVTLNVMSGATGPQLFPNFNADNRQAFESLRRFDDVEAGRRAARSWPPLDRRPRGGAPPRPRRWATVLRQGRRATLGRSSSAGGHRVAKPYVRLTQPLVRDTKGGELRSRDLGRGARPDRRRVHGREGGPRPDDLRHLQLLEGDQRGQLRGSEVQPDGPGQQQHRQLQPHLTRPERRRSGDRVRCRWRHKFIP